MKNWCRSIIHRLHRIEFIDALARQSIVIQNIHQLDCQRQANNSNVIPMIKQLRQKFIDAQKQLQLLNINDDNDIARLIRCIGCVLADNIAHKYMFRIFGFTSIIEQVHFINDNCNNIITETNIKRLEFTKVKENWDKIIRKYELNDVMQEDKKSLNYLRQSIDKLDSHCWKIFINYCTTQLNYVTANSSIVPLQILRDSTSLILKCIENARIK